MTENQCDRLILAIGQLCETIKIRPKTPSLCVMCLPTGTNVTTESVREIAKMLGRALENSTRGEVAELAEEPPSFIEFIGAGINGKGIDEYLFVLFDKKIVGNIRKMSGLNWEFAPLGGQTFIGNYPDKYVAAVALIKSYIQEVV